MLDDRVCTARGAHNFHDTLKAVRKYDERLANYVEARIPHTQWHDMVHEAMAEKRELYDRLKAVVEAMQQDAPAVVVEGIPTHPAQEGWEVARQIAATYRCDRGFIDKPEVHTVIVTLRGDEPITGLPPIILKASDGLARDMESVRKWTFGWDNRIFLMDLGPDAIRELKKHPAVASVEYSEEPEARILGTPDPPYNPGVEQTDWGVQRIRTSVPWGRTPPLYGKNVKVCVIDTGIDYNHQAYWKNGVCVYKGGFNFVGSNEDPRDDQDHGCLHPDGLVYTTFGIQRIEDLWNSFEMDQEEEKQVSTRNIWTTCLDQEKPCLGAARINKIFRIPVNGDIVSIKARSGMELKLTPWHPTFVFDGERIVERRADALREGDFLLRPSARSPMNHRRQIMDGIPVDESVAYAIGALIGDGFFHSPNKAYFGLSGKDADVGKKFLDCCEPYATSVSTWSEKRYGTKTFVVYGKPIYEAMLKLSGTVDIASKTYKASIPPSITLSSPSVIGAFLAGYLDTDGYVSGRVNTVIWSTVSKTMADQLSLLLSVIGIKSQLVVCDSRKENEIPCFQITVTGIDQIRNLHGLIGGHIASKKKKDRLEKIINKRIPYNVMNNGVPLSFEFIDRIRSKANINGINGRVLKGSKDRRSSKGPNKYRLLDLFGRLNKDDEIRYCENLINSFHFDAIVSVTKERFDGFFYDLEVAGFHNYLAGNFGGTFIHNTWCAGIVAEQHNGNGYRGVAPDVDLYACKALDSKGSGSYANIAASIDWARTNGMHIISLSLGGDASQAVLKTACDTAWYAGCLIVASAGNSGPDDNTVAYPAAYQSVIAVAAIDSNEQVASFSSRGPEVEIAAPGVNITAPWAGFTYDEYATPDGLYMCANGTSPACPHVSGAAALVKSWYPFMTNIDLRIWLRDHARDL